MLNQDTKDSIKDRLFYDPTIKGYDNSFFKTTGGTPRISGGDIRLHASSCTTYSQFLYGEFEFKATIASTPSAGEAKHWGLKNPASTMGSIYFDISGTTFTFKSYNSDNTATSTTITWNYAGATWNGVSTAYKITWTEKDIKAYIGGVLVATHESGDNNIPLAITLSNSDSDNMDIDYIVANKLGKWVV